jgi:hypothetical protein
MPVELLFSVAIGLALAAACGLRVFAPLFVLGLAAHFGRLHLTPGFDWAGTTPALVALGTATVVEIAAYYIPWLDHALDVISAPAALVAGVVATVAVLGDMPPWLRWSTGLIAGGGLAGLTKGAAALLRVKSTATTGGIANPAVATGESAGAIGLSLLAFLVPLLALILVVTVLFAIFRLAHRVVFGRRPAT